MSHENKKQKQTKNQKKKKKKTLFVIPTSISQRVFFFKVQHAVHPLIIKANTQYQNKQLIIYNSLFFIYFSNCGPNQIFFSFLFDKSILCKTGRQVLQSFIQKIQKVLQSFIQKFHKEIVVPDVHHKDIHFQYFFRFSSEGLTKLFMSVNYMFFCSFCNFSLLLKIYRVP